MYSVVMVTAKDKEEADVLAKGLLASQLAACVNIIPAIESLFVWQGKIESARESLMIIKTRTSLVKAVIDDIKARHSYDVCEVIALPIADGNSDYLNWIKSSTEAA